jgi:hypothetical protein
MLFKNVEPNGVLKVTFIDYVNPGGSDYDDGDGDSCCDILCDECDTYFEICLQATYVPVARLDRCLVKFVRTKVREDDNFNFISAFGKTFGSNGEKNPIEYHFDNSWKVCVTM